MKAIVGTVKMLLAFFGGMVTFVLAVFAFVGFGVGFDEDATDPESGHERMVNKAVSGWKKFFD